MNRIETQMVEVKPNGCKTPSVKWEGGKQVVYLPESKFYRLFPEAYRRPRNFSRRVYLVYDDGRKVVCAIEFPEQKSFRIKQYPAPLFWGRVKELTKWL